MTKRKFAEISYNEVDSDFLISDSEDSESEVDKHSNECNYQGVPKMLERSSREMYLQLYNSCKTGDVQKLAECIFAGLDLNRVDPSGQSPFYIACSNGKVAILKILLKHNVSFKVDPKLKPLFERVLKGCHGDIIAELINHGIDVQKLYPEFDLLRNAIDRNYTKVAVLLLKTKIVKEEIVDDIFKMVFRYKPLACLAAKKSNIGMLFAFQDLRVSMTKKDFDFDKMSFTTLLEHHLPFHPRNPLNYGFLMVLFSLFSNELLASYRQRIEILKSSGKNNYFSDQRYLTVSDMLAFENDRRTLKCRKWFLLGKSDKGSIVSRLPIDIIRQIYQYIVFESLPRERVDFFDKQRRANLRQKKDLYRNLGIF